MDEIEKVKNFWKLIRNNRKTLKDAGIKPSTIHAWESGHFPTLNNAHRISKLLNVPLSEIPTYYQSRN